nr:MAG TPA_asm: hypothetical protein [Bacteriophage sp.]
MSFRRVAQGRFRLSLFPQPHICFFKHFLDSCTNSFFFVFACIRIDSG